MTNLAHLSLIRTLNSARLPNRDIQRQLHHARPLPAAKPSPSGVGGREADAVVAGVGGAEGELARMGSFGVDNAVVVVEDFVDGYEDAEVGVGSEGGGLGMGLEGGVVAWEVASVHRLELQLS